MLALLAGCTTRTEHGECIGAFDEKKPGLEYKTSGRNVFLAIVFSETVVVPFVVALNAFRCPVAAKK
jgi:hypothetical protein